MTFIERFDRWTISLCSRSAPVLGRLALFTIYAWFGALKVLGLSPASAMVIELQHRTLPFVHGDWFMMAFGLFEVLIGLLFIIPRAERAALVLMVAHMVMTVLPLFCLPHMVWISWFVPTLEGQYIIKNIALIAIAAGLGARLVPLRFKNGAEQGIL